MPPLARGESRPRRSPSATRHHRSRSRTRSSASRFALPSSAPLIAFTDTLAHFVAAALVHAHPTIPSPFLAFPAFLLAAAVLLPLSARSPARKAFRSVTAPASLTLAHLLFLLEAVARLGPARTMLATAAATHLTSRVRRKRTTTTAIVAIAATFALGLVFHDAVGGGAIVKETVLRSRAGHAVTDRLHRISKSVESRVRVKERLSKLSEHYARQRRNWEQPEVPLEQQQLSADAEHHDDAVSRRRLLAIPTQDHERLTDREARSNGVNSDAQKLTDGPNISSGEAALQQHVEEFDDKGVVFGDSEHAGKEGKVHTNGNTTMRNDSLSGDVTNSARLTTHQQTFTAFLGIVFVILSSFANRIGSMSRQKLAQDIGDENSVSFAVFVTSAMMVTPLLLVYLISGRTGDVAFSSTLYRIAISDAILSLLLLVCPVLSHIHFEFRRGSNGSQPHQKKGIRNVNGFRSGSSAFIETDGLTASKVYPYVCLWIILLRKFSIAVFGFQDSLSFSSFLAAFLLLCISVVAPSQQRIDNRSESNLREHSRSSSSGDMSSIVGRGIIRELRCTWVVTSSFWLAVMSSTRDIIKQARLNKASWQVLNFLVLQSGMAIVELIYATVTHAPGLISISADNFFCCISLAIGLQAIRVTTRKPTTVYTYGFSRFESACGFANGVMLIYVAILIVLEAFERFKDTDNIAAGQTFTVCLFGMTGNILGLYFFPPESRRENHNVQGIYLHIWANTLAFASMAISTAIAAAVPAWEMIDMVSASIVGTGIVVLAIPLLLRSGRLLVLLVPTEKRISLEVLRNRLDSIDGVVKISGLRVWNLSPNSMVGSVRIMVANYFEGSDVDILYKARSIFASIGIPVSQCTIQVSRIEAESKAVVFFHKRSKSGFGDTGIDLEALQMCRELTT